MPKPSRHARPPVITRVERAVGATVALTLLTGTCAVLGAQGGATSAAPEARVQLTTQVLPSPVAVPAPKAAPTKQPAQRRTAPKKAPAKKAAAKPVQRWLPTGTGMWLHDWERSQQGNPRAVVARAKAVGLSTLYVQTGSSKKGFIGGPTLGQLLPATKSTGIKVIAWDFPTLKNPEADAKRMARAVRVHCGAGCPRVAAVAPDVETGAEGTRISDRAVARYYSALRKALPADIAILATVPWPSEKRRGSYPYARTARYADAIVPMAYWYNRDPAQVTATSMAYLAKFRKPVMPVGQGYDGRLDAPYLAADPTPGKSVTEFLTTAKRRGATHVSLWSWQTTGSQQWAALARSNGLFRPAVVRPGARTLTPRK